MGALGSVDGTGGGGNAHRIVGVADGAGGGGAACGNGLARASGGDAGEASGVVIHNASSVNVRLDSTMAVGSGSGGHGGRRGSHVFGHDVGMGIVGGTAAGHSVVHGITGGSTNNSGLGVVIAGSRSCAGGVADNSLFPCGLCAGQGHLILRNRDGHWCAQCTRDPGCQGIIWLPKSVVMAAVDGQCNVCGPRLRYVVRTLSMRLAHGYVGELLQPGTDTLQRVCIAGCNDILERLAA